MGAFGEYLGSKEISEEKKEIFSRQMMKILNYGGMMGFEAVRLYGHEMGLLKPVEIFSRENIHFHYNYFEDNVWETAGFKIDSCDLWSEKIGMAEFSDVIMAGYMLYEAYSEDGGMAIIDGEIIDSTEYMGWINHILGTSFSMKNRFNLWKNAENFALSRIRSGYDEFLSKQMFSKIIPKELKYAAGGTELADLLYIIHGTSTLIEEEKEMKQGTYSADILKCRQLLEKYFENNIDNPIEELWNFLKKEFGIREKESDDRMKEIADMSLRIPARVFVYLAVEINGNMEFWKEWKELKDVVYQDEKVTNYESNELMQWRKEEQETPIEPVATSKFLRQDGFFTFFNTPEELEGKPNYYISDDDRLYWWDGSDEVKISEKTDKWLKELVKQHKKLEETEEYEKAKQDFQKYFWNTIVEIEDYYKRIFPFRNMFYEFLENGNRKEYIAAVVLLKKLADSEEYRKAGEIIKYTRRWELTSNNVTHNYARIQLKRYMSVMANRKIREKYFGF